MDTAVVRETIINMLPDFGMASTDPNWETALIADGRYLGRRFEFDCLRVYWIWEHNTLEFYNDDWVLIGERKLQERAVAA